MVAAIVDADWLFLLTDVDALYDKNPGVHPDAKPIRVVDDIDQVVREGGLPLGSQFLASDTLVPWVCMVHSCGKWERLCILWQLSFQCRWAAPLSMQEGTSRERLLEVPGTN